MGAADIVPGVSGGTVALIFGIYKSLIANVRAGAHVLKSLLKADIRGAQADFKAIDWLFLVPLGAGVVIAFGLLRHPMEDALINHSANVAAVFCGLVAASCVLVWSQISDRSPRQLAILAAVTVAFFLGLGLQAGAVADPPLWAFALTGSIAICAMILPGISGSFIMLMLGMYAAVLGGSIAELTVFAVGAVIGLALFSSLLGWLLDHYEQTVLVVLLGIMLGSFRVLWPWPNGVGFEDEAENTVSGTGLGWPSETGDLVTGFALAAAAAVFTLVVVRFAKSDVDTANA